jgi:hypothetical protein
MDVHVERRNCLISIMAMRGMTLQVSLTVRGGISSEGRSAFRGSETPFDGGRGEPRPVFSRFPALAGTGARRGVAVAQETMKKSRGR